MTISIKDPKAVIVAVIGLVLIVASVVLLLGGYGKPGSPSQTLVINQPKNSVPVAVTQPPSAKDTATSLNCGRFQDLFKAGENPLVLDTGVCWIGLTKYGVNTFASSDARDLWLRLAQPFGIDPKWETATAVVYPATT